MSEATSLEQLCRDAEAKVALLISPAYHPMPTAACEVTQRIYATCVDFCQRADLPLSAIRVSLSAWGKKPNVKDRKTEHATELRFDGSKWSAVVAPHQRRYTPYAEGFGDLCLEERPAKLLGAVKLRGQDRYGVRVVSWHATDDPYDAEGFEIFDPWATHQRRPLVRLTDEVGTRDRVQITYLPRDTKPGDTVEIFVGTDESTGWSAKLAPGEDVIFARVTMPLYGRFPHRQGSATVMVNEEYKGSIMSTHVDTLSGYEQMAPTWTSQQRSTAP